MRTAKTLVLAALLALPATAALHAGQVAAGQETKRGDALLPTPPPGWQQPGGS